MKPATHFEQEVDRHLAKRRNRYRATIAAGNVIAYGLLAAGVGVVLALNLWAWGFVWRAVTGGG